jgi:molybdopterin-guanine dinucleotide biosynthesis protein A
MEVIHPLTKHQTSIGVYGTTCDDIQKWVQFFQIQSSIPTAYLDASHQEEELTNTLTAGSDFTKMQWEGNLISPFQFHWVNGNHFSAPLQIVIHNPQKVESLERRKSQLNNLGLVISADGMPAHLIDWGVVTEKTISLSPDDSEGIALWIQQNTAPAPLAVLILTGGLSERMGQDKAVMDYHGMPQWRFLSLECASLNLPVFYSVRNQEQAISREIPLENCIVDQYLDVGPLGGVMSAMAQHPEYSWVVMACDMPNWSAESIQFLISARNPKKMATAFWNGEKQWAEPLATIWERESKGFISMWMAQSRCARKLLARLPMEKIVPLEVSWLQNINSPQEKEDWIKRQVE